MPELRGPGPSVPTFGRSVNPIPTGEDRLSTPITTGTPNVFHLPASLYPNKYVIQEYSFSFCRKIRQKGCVCTFIYVAVIAKRGGKTWTCHGHAKNRNS